MQIIIFGTGEYYRRRRKCIKSHTIVAIVDNSTQRQGGKIDGVSVNSPECILKKKYDYICITSSYQEEILLQLEKLGVPSSKILKFTELGMLNAHNKSYADKVDLVECDIVLISHLMSHSGASIAFFNLAKILSKMGYRCSVLTVFDGDLREAYEREGISVYEEDWLDIRNEKLVWLLKRKKMIICNTIYLRHLVHRLQTISVPIIWWLHESQGFRAYLFPSFQAEHHNNLRVFGVGPLACQAYKEKFKDDKIEELLYMVNEEEIKTKKVVHKEVVFAIIGSIYYEKGQDIFLDAIKGISPEIRRQCLFKVIGKVIDNNMYEKLKMEEIDELVVKEELTREELRREYETIDVVVSASRSDTMPTSIIEAMLNRRCCIVSGKSGVANYVTDGENGFVLHELKSEELQKKMEWIVLNRDRAFEIGQNSFEVYKNNFSENSFRKRVGDILGEVITS